ncbi:hypothetical protein BGZ73_005705 [Actinomortierella ambigua]|nr:hypothetical protein BGZ73_005705 [Actinomortierella ambigua]
MTNGAGFHELSAWFAPEYEKVYSSVWAKCGGQLKSLEEADLAVITDESPPDVATSKYSYWHSAIVHIENVNKKTRINLRMVMLRSTADSSKIRSLEGKAALEASHFAKYSAPPRPTRLPLCATASYVPQQSVTSPESSDDDEWHDALEFERETDHGEPQNELARFNGSKMTFTM